MKTQKPGGPGGRDANRNREGDKELTEIAKEALDAFSADAKEEYTRLVNEYEGSAAVIGVFGLGAVTISVRKGQVEIDPAPQDSPQIIGRGAIYPQTLVALAEGKMTVMEAFHKGELLARAHSDQLHKAYDFFVRFSDAALRSQRLQKVLQQFRNRTGC